MEHISQANEAVEAASPRPLKQCENCETPLQGVYCHQCGQQQGTSIRNVFSLIQEFFGEIGNWDSRVIRTLIPLMFRPGVLSREYVAGRRAPYVPPLRLYLFTSIICFVLLFTYFDNIGQQVDNEVVSEANAPTIVSDALRQRNAAENQITADMHFLTPEQQAMLNARVQRIGENPELLLRQIKAQAPQMMFFLLPLFALILKALYPLSKRYYMEHLILALHTHAFLFLMLILWIPLDMLTSLSGLPAWLERLLSIIGTLWVVWIFTYLFISQKRFYQQSWPMSIYKYLLTGLLYSTMLLFGIIGLFLISVLTA